MLNKRGKIEDDGCQFRCNAVEDAHHIFVDCARYTGWQKKAADDLRKKTEMKLIEKGVEEAAHEGLLTAAMSIFSHNDTIWPLKHTFYHLGHLAPLEKLLPNKAVNSKLENITGSHDHFIMNTIKMQANMVVLHTEVLLETSAKHKI
ncbi:hypothetical protein FB451DRAFT_1182236 [Mycena latifolia]|nr:hypothetical protein FB451DRAFT_1182236 [Mycena latifolia]